MSSFNAHLKELLAELSAELPEVSERRMFGAEAFFANDSIYAMVWDGRVLLKFPDEPQFEKARSLEDSGLFDPMGSGKTMGRWVAMPEGMIDAPEVLRPWVEEAHREAMRQPPKKKPVKKPAKKTAAPKKKKPAKR